jgi:glycosyltransferase involved in cell wall biosynthesis
MKKILIIGPFPEPITGQSIANKILKIGLEKMNVYVDILDTNTNKKLQSYNKQGKIGSIKILISLNQIFFGVLKIFIKKYDIIYITPGQTYLGFIKYSLFMLFGKLLKKKVYVHFHGGLFGNMYKDLSNSKKKIIGFLLKKIDGVIVLSKSLKYMVEDLIDVNRIFVCENGIENNYLINNPKKKSNKLKLLYLSNLMKTKGILDLLNATKLLDENNIDYELNIAGNIEDEIKEEVNSFLKNNKIKYHGVVSGNKKYELLNEANIFCLPTYYPVEGQPISILEAMGMGNAIVTTNQGGIKDIVENGKNGIICNKKDPKSIYISLLKAYEDFEVYSINNIKEIKRKYTQDKFIERLYNVLMGEINENINNNGKL